MTIFISLALDMDQGRSNQYISDAKVRNLTYGIRLVSYVSHRSIHRWSHWLSN
ncbi:hypothetical protein Syun_030664 [Stephania yunnanensis]|uniref:Uncharacterized protein n=1 Tax=Stephania yunnanensis TaxID=152371 RepID=A0AAP0HE23_9MAGN